MARYTTEAEVREAPDLSGTAASSELINRAIDSAEAAIDEYTGTSWSPTTHTVSVLGDGSSNVVLSILHITSIDSLTVGGEAGDVADVTLRPFGVVELEVGWLEGSTYEITLTAGISEPPADIKAAAKLEAIRRARVELLRARSRNSGTQNSNEHGQFTYPNWSGKFGPSDDAEVLRTLNNRRQSGRGRFSR